ncbi:MAG TPA: diaminopimelate epimerase, partial [Rhodothermales bacterium]
MHRKLVLEFTKMNGAGNDFIVVDNRFYHFSDQELSDLARKLCPRRFAVGADGVLAFSHPREKEHDYRMIYYNADGSRGTMCGNGARCLARFAHDAGMVRDELRFESDAGVYRAIVDGGSDDSVRLFVQPP